MSRLCGWALPATAVVASRVHRRSNVMAAKLAGDWPDSTRSTPTSRRPADAIDRDVKWIDGGSVATVADFGP